MPAETLADERLTTGNEWAFKNQGGNRGTNPCRRASGIQQLRVIVGIRRGAATEDFQLPFSSVFNPVRRAGRDADRFPDADRKRLLTQRHQPCSGGDVINLLAALMPVQLRNPAHRHHRLRQTLVRVAVHRGVYQFADDGTVFGYKWFYFCIVSFAHHVRIELRM